MGVDGEKVALEGWTGGATLREGDTRDTCVGLNKSKALRKGYRTVVCIQRSDRSKARQEVTRGALDVSNGLDRSKTKKIYTGGMHVFYRGVR